MLSPRARVKILTFFIFRFRPFWGRIFILRRFSLKVSSKSAFEHCAKGEKECKSHAMEPGAIIQSAQGNPLLVENVQRFDSAERTLIRGSTGVATRIRMEWKGNG